MTTRSSGPAICCSGSTRPLSASPWSVPRPSLPRPGRPSAPPPQRWMRPRRSWWRRSRNATTSASRRRASSSWCASGVYPLARGDQARSQLDAAEAQVQQAQASLEQARQALGPKGADNPQIREALAALEQARLDLTRTTLLRARRRRGNQPAAQHRAVRGRRPAGADLPRRAAGLAAGLPAREQSGVHRARHAGRGGARRAARARAAGAGGERRLGRRRGRYGSHDRPAEDAPEQRRMVRAGAALPGATGVRDRRRRHHAACATMRAPASSSTPASTRSRMRSPGSGSG